MARIAIVGAGAAGSALAVLLARACHEVHLFEAVADPLPVGAGLLLQPSGREVLSRLGLLQAVEAHGARVTELFGDTPSGRTVMRLNYRHLAPEAFGLGVQRGVLMGVLWQAVRDSGVTWHTGAAVKGFGDGGSGVLLHGDSASAQGRFDLLVLANGSFSTLRRALPVPQQAQLFPWGALWCVLPTPAGELSLQLRQRYRAARQMIGLMPVGHAYAREGPRSDARQGTTLFWSLPAASLDEWQRAPDLPALKHEMQTLLPLTAPWLEGLNDAAQLRVARYADVWMAQWHHGRVAVIGDCAHGMSPQLGQGANMALVDAWVMATCIAEHGASADALAEYSRQRRSHLRFYQQASRWLTPLFQSSQIAGPLLRDLVFGLGGGLPLIRSQSAAALAGLKTGWLGGRLKL